jgi:tetratricopeptide (TPR) repeat protein
MPESPPLAAVRPAGFALCESTLSHNHAATKQFWDTFSKNDTAMRAMAITALEQAVQQHPSEAEFSLLAGLANLWRLAVPTSAEANNQLGFLLAAIKSKNQLERASKLCPSDYRIGAWLGPLLVNIGKNAMDQATVDKGLAVLQEGIAHYPSFVLFSQLLIYADRPRGDVDFQKALDAINSNLAQCLMPTGSVDPACTNSAKVPHNREGGMVFLGDIYAKAGQRSDALSVYEAAKKVPEYATWPYQQLLNSRIANIDARIKLYDDADPKNDPDNVWSGTLQCAICHHR